MSISGQGWELHIVRQGTQRRPSDGKVRTIGNYQVYHDGVAVSGLAGMTAESRGPGDNAVTGNNRRVEAKRYPLRTHSGERYVSIGYVDNDSTGARPKPGILLGDTGNRVAILIHPGQGFLASIGCINLCTSLPDAAEPISYPGSRRRVIALLADMKAYLGAGFPTKNGIAIPKAWAVIEGEP